MNNSQKMQRLTLAALFAALAWVVFVLLRFRIPGPSPSGGILIHFANCICVLAGMVLGPWWGGLAGAVGLTLADLTAGYAHAMIPTFFSKFLIGLIAGILVKRLKIRQQTSTKARILRTLVIAVVILLVINPLFDPWLRYQIYQLIGIEKNLAKYYQWLNIYASLINGVTNSALLLILYSSISKAVANTQYRSYFYSMSDSV